MIGEPALSRSTRHIIILVCAITAFGVPAPSAGEPRYTTPTLYLSGDTLLVDVSVDSLLSLRAREAIASGMTTSITYEFLLQPARGRTRRHIESYRLNHDIWEGRYTIFQETGRRDSLMTDRFNLASKFVSELGRIPVAVLPDDQIPYVLQIRSIVNPISPEQEVKTRRWLNLLEKGSVLELFFSFAPRDHEGDFVQVARFRKQDLPSEVIPPTTAPDPEDATQAPDREAATP